MFYPQRRRRRLRRGWGRGRKPRVRAMKEKRDSKCQPGKFIFIVQCWQRIASGLAFRVIREDFLRRKLARRWSRLRILVCCIPTFLKCMRFSSDLFSRRATRDEGVSLLHGIKKRLSRSFFPRDDRQPSQINSLSGGIISPKWPFINKRSTKPGCWKMKILVVSREFPDGGHGRVYSNWGISASLLPF